MGSLTLSFLKKIVPFLLIRSVHARTVHGIELKEELLCGGKALPLQSAALRTATFFKIKVYVVALYAEKKMTANFTETNKPVCFEITYLRDVSDADADRAWEYQFKESSDFPYKDLTLHVQKLKEFFGDIKDERKHLFELKEGATLFSENGKLKGEISGEEFQKNFLSIWFGKNPPTAEVKEALLK